MKVKIVFLTCAVLLLSLHATPAGREEARNIG